MISIVSMERRGFIKACFDWIQERKRRDSLGTISINTSKKNLAVRMEEKVVEKESRGRCHRDIQESWVTNPKCDFILTV